MSRLEQAEKDREEQLAYLRELEERTHRHPSRQNAVDLADAVREYLDEENVPSSDDDSEERGSVDWRALAWLCVILVLLGLAVWR